MTAASTPLDHRLVLRDIIYLHARNQLIVFTPRPFDYGRICLLWMKIVFSRQLPGSYDGTNVLACEHLMK